MKYHLITFGCQMNKSDSERIAGLLEELGYTKTDKPDSADLIILNSCSVRQAAEDRVFGKINNFKKLKKKNPNLILAITGCMPGRDVENKFKKKMPELDFYFPISELENLSQMLHHSNNKKTSIRTLSSTKFNAHIPIQTGCNRFCTYCVVPYSRGREKCRSVKEILSEIKNIVESGHIYIELLGQVVNNYIAPDPKSFSNKNPY
ncbi:MAG: radical SAM protein, partial [Parcubacteria group bacterium]|nr:radical SAM protein [Parcubacteria group bacterium]